VDAWATRRAAVLLDRPVADLHLVLARLSGGSSVCAVRDGRSVDTSMGFTPLDGVPMSTRSGAVDPGMLLWLLDDDRLTRDQLGDGLYHRSGLLGLSGGRSGDTRELATAAAATTLDRLDALAFTGEIGWNTPTVRRDICAGLHMLGVREPVRGNRADDGRVSAADAAVPVLVVEAREELQIAAETRHAVRHTG
jgi:acetate kinase